MTQTGNPPAWDAYPILEPQGDIFIPLCTTQSRLEAMLEALNSYWSGHRMNKEHEIDLIAALQFIDDPLQSPCVQELIADCDIVCRKYKTPSFTLTYAPNDPYQTPNLSPEPYNHPPWYAWQGEVQGVDLPEWLTEVGTGAKIGDVFVLPYAVPDVFDDLINIIPDPLAIAALLEQGFPRFRFHFLNAGTVELHLLKIPFGGLAIITADDDPLSYKIVSLSTVNLGSILDWEGVITTVLGSLGSEGFQLVDSHIVEMEVDGTGSHHIDVTFIPYGDLDGDFGFGGGLRKIELCGESAEGVEILMPQFQMNENGELLWRPNHETSWENLGLVRGADGLDGLNGQNGQDGQNGFTPIPIWSGFQLAFDLNADGIADTTPVNVRGAQGAQGENGDCEDCGEQLYATQALIDCYSKAAVDLFNRLGREFSRAYAAIDPPQARALKRTELIRFARFDQYENKWDNSEYALISPEWLSNTSTVDSVFETLNDYWSDDPINPTAAQRFFETFISFLAKAAAAQSLPMTNTYSASGDWLEGYEDIGTFSDEKRGWYLAQFAWDMLVDTWYVGDVVDEIRYIANQYERVENNSCQYDQEQFNEWIAEPDTTPNEGLWVYNFGDGEPYPDNTDQLILGDGSQVVSPDGDQALRLFDQTDATTVVLESAIQIHKITIQVYMKSYSSTVGSKSIRLYAQYSDVPTENPGYALGTLIADIEMPPNGELSGLATCVYEWHENFPLGALRFSQDTPDCEWLYISKILMEALP